MSLDQKISQISSQIKSLQTEISKVFIGQEELVLGTLAALFSKGHVLIEGVPGLGKTLLVRALGKILGADFSRIQFTPDLMPSDITGSHIFNQREQKFVFVRGPVFTNLLLADEINRAPAKTHSALLEIMQENQVTIDNRQYRIEPPFFVMATQNPVESEGTYTLPEAQLDRFLLKLLIQYPAESEEQNIIRLHTGQEQFDLLQRVEPIMNVPSIMEIIQLAAQIRVSESIIEYITRLVRATRSRQEIYLGCSPRAGIALMKTARVLALMEGRDYIVPDDVKALTPAAFRHRIVLTPEAEVEGRTPDDAIRDVLAGVDVPRSDH
ncbi:MAG: MoxR family ATPase [Leptospiraceae bacterium]|nr:MoxR family ATPase [Leptospiraceae bacterium]